MAKEKPTALQKALGRSAPPAASSKKTPSSSGDTKDGTQPATAEATNKSGGRRSPTPSEVFTASDAASDLEARRKMVQLDAARKAAQQAAQYVPAPDPPDSLFPVRLPVILLSGPPDAGKTIAATLLDPARTLYLDTEKSAEPYYGDYCINTWIDVPTATHADSGKTVTPEAMFHWLRRYIASVPVYSDTPPVGFRVCVLDTADIIEEGIAAMVAADPKKFRLPTADVEKINALFWAAVKGVWRSVLVDAIARFETTIIITHQKEEYKGGKPSGTMIPGGKDTLVKLASLVLMLSRPTSPKTNAPVDKPVARVVKGRISKSWTDPATGEVIPRRLIPPQIPRFTFGKLRWYMENPPDFDALKPEEVVPPDILSADERLKLKAQTAQAVLEAQRIHAERERSHEEWRQAQLAAGQRVPRQFFETAPEAEEEDETPSPSPEDSGALLPNPDESTDRDPEGPPSDRELEVLAQLHDEAVEAGMTDARWKAMLKHHGIDPNSASVTSGQVQAIIRQVACKLDLVSMYTDLYGEPESDEEE